MKIPMLQICQEKLPVALQEHGKTEKTFKNSSQKVSARSGHYMIVDTVKLKSLGSVQCIFFCKMKQLKFNGHQSCKPFRIQGHISAVWVNIYEAQTPIM